MKLAWKLTFTQTCLVVCIGLISFLVISSSFAKLRDEYIRAAVENRFQRITKDIEDRAKASVVQASMIVCMPAVIRAYEIAISGKIDNPNSPQSQAARELLRKEFAPILDSHEKITGQKLRIHFHLRNGLSLVRLWRLKNTGVDGRWVDISDNTSWYRHTVMEVNKSSKVVMGIESGSGGFAIHSVIPVEAPGGRYLGSAEVLQDFDPLPDVITNDGEVAVSMYASKEQLALQDLADLQLKGDFVRVGKEHAFESLITPEMLFQGKKENFYINRGSVVLAAHPLIDYGKNHVGVVVFVMKMGAIFGFVRTAGITLVLMLTCMVLASSASLLIGSYILVTNPIDKIKTRIKDIVEDRADLNEQVPAFQKDEIGEIARWFNKLTAKVGVLLDGLREAEERAQSLLDATPLCACLFDKDANVIYCNQVVATRFELSDKQEFMERFYELSPEYQPCGRLSRELALEYIAKALEEGNFYFEWVHQKLNGDLVPCEITLVRVKLNKDYIVASYSHDLRERRDMLNELRKESMKFEAMAYWYESILDSIPSPVSILDKEGRCKFINAAFEKLLMKKREDVIGMYCSDWHISICGTDDCAIACANRGQNQTYFRHEGASYQVHIEKLKNRQDETTGFIKVVQDVTKLEQVIKQHAEAEATSRAKSAFLAKMSHEIRTPINAVLGITEMQLQSATLSFDIQDALSKIYTAGYTLLGIINDILDLSKIESGKMELIPARYEIASLIGDAVQLNMSRIGSKKIEFNLQIGDDVPSELFGDELRIKQILNNLLSNAFKYTQKGKVDLSVSAEYGPQEGDSDVVIVFRVKDTGQGMEDWQVRMLFDEYSRFDMAANRKIEGTGLGMNITQYLVNMMNGEISVESEPEKGSLFTVRLPQSRIGANVLDKGLAYTLLWSSNAAALRTKVAQIVREPMPYGKVLIVDDLEINLYVSKGLLAPYGLSIDTALSGFEVIDKIRGGEKYDIVFMDHMMPKMDGVETTKILRDLGYAHPIVALTANALVGQAEMFLENGFDDFLSKPMDMRQMDMVLNKFIRDKQPPEVIEAARKEHAGINTGGKTSEASMDPQLARTFAHDAEKVVITLGAIFSNRFRRDDDVRMFIINAHAMKNALLNIGELELASAAYKLERIGEERDIDVMLAEMPAFLNELKAVIEKIKPKEE